MLQEDMDRYHDNVTISFNGELILLVGMNACYDLEIYCLQCGFAASCMRIARTTTISRNMNELPYLLGMSSICDSDTPREVVWAVRLRGNIKSN